MSRKIKRYKKYTPLDPTFSKVDKMKTKLTDRTTSNQECTLPTN
jgi:hypothetical protein